MPQEKKTAPSVLDVVKNVKKGKILPLYYLFGEDSFGLDSAVKAIEDAVNPFITTDFDKEVCYSDDRSLQEVINSAYAFPFGSEKKLIIFKEAEKARDKKYLEEYISSPAEFSVLVLVHNGKITNLTTPPFNLLLENDFLYEAKELKGRYLVDWTIELINSKGKQISYDNAQYLVEISGENRAIIESQVEKILSYLDNTNEISLDIIKKVTSSFLQFTIFDLQEAIFQKDKSKALSIAFNMLDNGENAVAIVSMLTKAFIGLSQITEFKGKNLSDAELAKLIGVPYFTIKNYKTASMLFTINDLECAAQALLRADVTIKTTQTDHKTVLAILIDEFF